MLPGIEEALIGAGAVCVASGVALLGARAAARATVKSALDTISAGSKDIEKQIDAASADVREQLTADREQRVWEKRAGAYTDAIAAIRYEQKVRGGKIVASRIGTEPDRPKPPVDPVDLEARMVAFCSPAVLGAQRAYVAGAEKFEVEYQVWNEDTEHARQAQQTVASGTLPNAWPTRRSSRDDLDNARSEADKLSDEVIALIRSELHGG